jgi:hypothetical protein
VNMKFIKILTTSICFGVLFNCGAQETKLQFDDYLIPSQLPSRIEKK